jgi:hypothetical protein
MALSKRPFPVSLALVLCVMLGGVVAVAGRQQASPARDETSRTELELLLNPRALAPAGAAQTDEQMKSAFVDPPSVYRSVPLWVWNDELEWPRLKEQMGQFKEQGMGGVFVHPRPGLMTEYMGTDWLRLWKQSAEEGKRLGLSVNIYDENSYPSGFAGGFVPAQAPDTASQYVQAVFNIPEAEIPWGESRTGAGSIAVFSVTRSDSGDVTSAERIYDRSDLVPGRKVLVFRLRRSGGNPWTAGFPYVDLTNPETAPAFIATTLEPYKKVIGSEFGRTVKWVFDDEPLLATGGAYDQDLMSLPLSRNTLAEFHKRCGYDLADHLPSLYWDTGDFMKVRYDYWQTLHDLWKENYMAPLFRWCDSNDLQFTGHWMEHTWPVPTISPADASLYAYEHVPGIDMLEGTNVRLHGSDPRMLFVIKQMTSVAHQLGRRAFCEAFGVSGWDSTFEHYKRFGDWLMVHGVNFMDQHLAFATVRGARKRDHPQSFTDIAAWWPYYRLHADHIARVSYMLFQGRPANRTLLLEPTTSGFLRARGSETAPELLTMRSEYSGLVQALADRQVDFDLGDEYILEWFGKQHGAALQVGRSEYNLLVWPRDMVNLRHESLPILEKYLASGGEILALSAPAVFIDGRPDSRFEALVKRFAAKWHPVAGTETLLKELLKRNSPRVVFEDVLPNVGLNERTLDNGDRILFFANSASEGVRTRVTVRGGGLEIWDTTTGAVGPAPFTRKPAGGIQFDLDLPAAGSALYRVTRASRAPAPPSLSVRYTAASTGDWRIKPERENVLVLDYCDLKLPLSENKDIHTWRANWLAWQAHGFERPAWDNAVQFRTRVFDRNRFPRDSGFEATFPFEITDAAAIKGLQLVVEVPELYRIEVNGKPVSFAGAPAWIDTRFRRADIAGAVVVGRNQIRLIAHPFDVRMELENVYLLGDFAAVPAAEGFAIAAPKPLGFGAWLKQGYAFFGNTVDYETEVVVPEGTSRMKVTLGDWRGSVAEVLVDGRRAAVLGWPPYEASFAVSPGKRILNVRIVSNPRNLFGPFHNPEKPRMVAWSDSWSQFAEHQPAGSDYDLVDYGLMKPPAISVGAEARR